MRLPLGSVLGILYWSLALLNCTGEEARLGLCDGDSCPAKCRSLSTEGTCDVFDVACQERIFRAVGCVREQEGELPFIRVLTPEEQRAEDEQNAQGWSGADAGTGSDAASEDTGQEPTTFPLDLHERALGLLGLWQERSNTAGTARITGYYRGDDGITLIDRGESGDSKASQRNLAHEFVHAYQDQRLGLDSAFSLSASTLDARLAKGCLVEGEARFYELLAWGLLSGTSLDEAALREVYEGDIERARSIVVTKGSPHHDIALLRYGLGSRHLLTLWLQGGNRAVQALLDAPPLTSVYWMRAIEEHDDPRWLQSTRRLTCTRLEPPEGTTSFGSDKLGALYLFALLASAPGKPDAQLIEQSWQLALEWQQDSFEMFLEPGQKLAVSWRIRLTDAEVARDAERALSLARPTLRTHREGAELEVRAAESTELLDRWTTFGRCGSSLF